MSEQQPWRDDPEWQAARERLVADMADDETPSAAMYRRVRAIAAMSEIEIRHGSP